MKVIDLFAGLEGWSKPFRERGHDVCSTDVDPRFEVDIIKNILDLKPNDFPWKPDVILASPPCEAFSLAGKRSWDGVHPTSIQSKLALKVLQKTISLIQELDPRYFIIENPRGMMRGMPEVQSFERRTITYCQYGMPYMKPTDLWGGFPPSLVLRPMCFKGAKCHEYVSGKMKTGIRGCNSAAVRSIVPYELALDVCCALEKDLKS